MRPEIIIALPDIRSVFNTASVFRTADAAGVNRILLSGYTPQPLDRFGRPRKDFAKVALGAEKTISWNYEEDLPRTLSQLKKEGYACVALEQHPRSVDYRAFKAPSRVVLVAGNEVEGISPGLLAQMDAIIEIPLPGAKESLNVEVALGIALFSLLPNT
jgi:23S rRNA (guanosine2251-2'-O)-methyltransferase